MKHRAFALMSAVFVTGLLQNGFGIPEAQAREVVQFGDSGYFRIDYQLQARAGERNQRPDLRDNATYDFYLRRNRLSLIGAANDMFSAVAQLEFNGGQQLGDTSVMPDERKYELVLLDAFANANLTDYLKVRVGKTKHVLTREVQEGCFDPLSIDRSLFILGPFNEHSPEKTTRDVGLVLWGNAYNDMIQYRLAAMQGNHFGTTPNGIGWRYTGRVHATFFDKESGIVYRGTYLGKKRVLTVGAGYELQPNAVFSSADPLTGVMTGAENYSAYTFDVFYEHPTNFGTFTVSGAYLKTDFGEAGLRGVTDAQSTSGERNGYYWKAGYMWRDFQVFGRFENWSFATLNNVLGQQIRWYAAGVNYYLKGEDVRFTLEYSLNDFQREPAKDFHTILLQLQAQI